jgi:hypothetical protein
VVSQPWTENSATNRIPIEHLQTYSQYCYYYYRSWLQSIAICLDIQIYREKKVLRLIDWFIEVTIVGLEKRNQEKEVSVSIHKIDSWSNIQHDCHRNNDLSTIEYQGRDQK